MNANVKRAISASLDVKAAEARRDQQDLSERLHLEKLARAALKGGEVFEYQVGVTNAYEDVQARAAALRS